MAQKELEKELKIVQIGFANGVGKSTVLKILQEATNESMKITPVSSKFDRILKKKGIVNVRGNIIVNSNNLLLEFDLAKQGREKRLQIALKSLNGNVIWGTRRTWNGSTNYYEIEKAVLAWVKAESWKKELIW